VAVFTIAQRQRRQAHAYRPTFGARLQVEQVLAGDCPPGAALDQRGACPFVELQVRHADFHHRLAHAQCAQRQAGVLARADH
jgi:hypothetical protein